MSGSVFAKFVVAEKKEQPEPTIIAPSGLNFTLTKLLTWLINHWPDATISARDLITYTWYIRTIEEAITLAESLVRRGYLIPLPTHRYDRRVWMIVRDPAQVRTPANAAAVLPPNTRASSHVSNYIETADTAE